MQSSAAPDGDSQSGASSAATTAHTLLPLLVALLVALAVVVVVVVVVLDGQGQLGFDKGDTTTTDCVHWTGLPPY